MNDEERATLKEMAINIRKSLELAQEELEAIKKENDKDTEWYGSEETK